MMVKLPIFLVNTWHQVPYLTAIGCEVYGVVSVISGMAAIWSVTAIVVERAWVISFSKTSAFNKLKMIHAVGIVACIWVLAVFFSICPLLGWNEYQYEGYLVSCSIDLISHSLMDKTYVYCLLLLGWVGPNITIFYCSFCIVKSNRENNASMIDLMRATGSSITSTKAFQLQRIQEERKLWKISLILLIVWMCSWTPYAIVVATIVTGK
ncbi:rhodopsin, GQ-coupled [Eurytemora carolleeae]|uniref:rhodopsin, GQ-coupled n=1 Tax=Eurytemora carolleeae TaxID=1294199 RepID=UPI000C76D327|nr:rhodopsin, GQ-coupled [Eurytemora carolleeae]|eukprot:XP_023328775.1 rhodopsin, GQ-coupled-like [Eurytemora affinis]